MMWGLRFGMYGNIVVTFFTNAIVMGILYSGYPDEFGGEKEVCNHAPPPAPLVFRSFAHGVFVWHVNLALISDQFTDAALCGAPPPSLWKIWHRATLLASRVNICHFVRYFFGADD